MEFFETIIKKRSVRAFKKEPIEEWKITRSLWERMMIEKEDCLRQH